MAVSTKDDMPSAAPSRKVALGSLAGAAAGIATYFLNRYAFGDALPEDIKAMFILLVTGLVGPAIAYLVPPSARDGVIGACLVLFLLSGCAGPGGPSTATPPTAAEYEAARQEQLSRARLVLVDVCNQVANLETAAAAEIRAGHLSVDQVNTVEAGRLVIRPICLDPWRAADPAAATATLRAQIPTLTALLAKEH